MGLGESPWGIFSPPLLRWTTLYRKGFENQTATTAGNSREDLAGMTGIG
jgi:hypothetical protein